MLRNPVPLIVLASLPFLTACSNSDREQAAKSEDGVSTFRYQPPDMKKYTQKREQPRQPPASAPAPAKQPESTPSASSPPKAAGK